MLMAWMKQTKYKIKRNNKKQSKVLIFIFGTIAQARQQTLTN